MNSLNSIDCLNQLNMLCCLKQNNINFFKFTNYNTT